jgi:hypothetical protein
MAPVAAPRDYGIYAYEVHAHEMHVYEVHIHEMHSCEVQVYEQWSALGR